MSKIPEEELDQLIDSLNNERKPKQILDSETAQLYAALRAVKSLRPPVEPRENFGEIIYNAIKKPNRRPWLLVPAAALAAGFLIFAILFSWTSHENIVYAMEKAVANLTNYHGVLEIRAENQAGENYLVRRAELWSEGEKYAVRQDNGTLTVNNGQRRWQVRPQDKEIALLPLVPDPTGQGFDLRDEAKRAKEYPQTILGQELVAGRKAIKLEISPPGGLPYYLWIDKETKLPLQLQTAMQNALQTTYTFISFTPNTAIEPEIFAFKSLKGYKIIEKDPGQQVATVIEAAAISHFTPLLPQASPARIFAFQNRIVLDYGAAAIVQTPAKGAFKPENISALGQAAGGPLEVIGESLRWQQQGLVIQIIGPNGAALAKQIAKDITLPETSESLVNKAQIKVPIDLEIVKGDQQQVDGGHSPWQLDPLYVAFTFVNLQVSPAGIQGEPEIPETAFKLIASNGAEAVVKVTASPVKNVYLKRLVRQDETGIWTVVGYDPR